MRPPSHTHYRGRFAPSPSGPLHFGSLVCALASYLDAKIHKGIWLVRIEDIDPPREQAGAADDILACLQAHGLHWHDEVLYQHSRSTRYRAILEHLQKRGLSYFCNCNRKRIQTLSGRYDGRCRKQLTPPARPAAIRLNTALACPQAKLELIDDFQGSVSEDFGDSGDFIIHRKDGLFAYQLAVSVDDIDQGISHVVRGVDLLDSTPKQALLMQTLDTKPPAYAHIPVIVNDKGDKLSKQNHAPAIDPKAAITNLQRACKALFGEYPNEGANLDSAAILQWASARWAEYRRAAPECYAARSIEEAQTFL